MNKRHIWHHHSIIIAVLLYATGQFILFGCGNEQKNLKSEKTMADPAKDSLSWAIRMTESEINRRGESLRIGGTDPKAKWNYQTGLFLKSVLDLWHVVKEDKYLHYVTNVIDSFVDESGNIKMYKMEDYNIDKINSGKVLLDLYLITENEKYKNAAMVLRRQLASQPRTKEGGFWHKKRYPWQMWLDGIYMGSPFYARYSQLFNEPEGFDDVVKQIVLIDSHTRDPKTGLRYHGWDESNQMAWADPETGCSPNFWGRAMGWYSMALVDVLDYLPENYAKRKQVQFILNDLLEAIVRYQDDESGLWYQVVDQAERDGNYLEASASSMFVYALTKATQNNYVAADYLPAARKAYQGILKHLIRVDSDGSVNLLNVCSVAGLGGDPFRDGSFEYYINEPVVENDLKGVGPFIMASLLLEKQ